MKTTRWITFLFFLTGITFSVTCQQIKIYQKVTVEDYEFPLLIRGNLSSGIILLFVQGGPGETAIDFARADYPKWKHGIEKEVAVAYFDQRGLNQKLKKIDSLNINYHQYGLDIISLGNFLKDTYDVRVIAFGHSAGGRMVLEALSVFPEESSVFESAIIANTPMTTDFSPERNSTYRPLYLENLAQEKISLGEDIEFWEEASQWMDNRDSISTIEDLKKWRSLVNHAFEAERRKITLGMALRVIFSPPYNPISYFNRKDNDLVDDLLWEDERILSNGREKFQKIRIPVLLLTGRFDDIARPEEVKVLGEQIFDSQFYCIPDAGHEAFLDQPELFKKLTIQFAENGSINLK